MAQQNVNIKSATTKPTAASAQKRGIRLVLDRADYETACAQEACDHYGEPFTLWWGIRSWVRGAVEGVRKLLKPAPCHDIDILLPVARSVTALFMFSGYRDAIMKLEKQDEHAADIAKVWIGGGGEYEVACRFEAVAATIDKAVGGLRASQNFPGVWEYEIAERIGSWCVQVAPMEGPLTDNDLVEYALFITQEWIDANGEMHVAIVH